MGEGWRRVLATTVYIEQTFLSFSFPLFKGVSRIKSIPSALPSLHLDGACISLVIEERVYPWEGIVRECKRQSVAEKIIERQRYTIYATRIQSTVRAEQQRQRHWSGSLPKRTTATADPESSNPLHRFRRHSEGKGVYLHSTNHSKSAYILHIGF